MNKFSIYYIITNFLLFSTLQLGAVVNTVIIPLCIIGLFSVGVAHGSIDHILFGADKGRNKRTFVQKYLLMILAVGIVWFLSPNLSLILFLVLSAYHFGQSQFTDYSLKDGLLTRMLYFSWGILLFSLLFYLKQEELISSFASYFPNISIFEILAKNALLFLVLSSVSWLLLIGFKILKSKLTYQNLFSELYLILLISISFYVFPTIIGFSLYFIILHSLRSIDQEYRHLFIGYSRKNIWKFTRLLLPFTILAIIGSIVIVGISFKFGFQNQIPFILLILLSSVTTPHTFVMDYFLENRRQSVLFSRS